MKSRRVTRAAKLFLDLELESYAILRRDRQGTRSPRTRRLDGSEESRTRYSCDLKTHKYIG